jgi:Icc-related predicted phosphoesterase
MRALFFSDNHGHINRSGFKGKHDLLISGGDFCQDFNEPVFARKHYQTEWLEDSAKYIKQMLGGRDFLFTLGNHDYVNPEEMELILRSEGINATCLHNKVVSYNGVNFYGFPYVPPITGTWSYESTVDEMKEYIKPLREAINNSQVDVIVAHCPIYGCMDESDNGLENYGNSTMANMLDYEIEEGRSPSYYMTGHIHSRQGLTKRGDLTVVNAATSNYIIQL